MNQLYLSSYHLEPRHAASYLEALRKHRVRHLLGYSSSLATLARYMLELGLHPDGILVVVTNAEPLLEHQRTLIAEAFRCPVRETYGMCELVAAASECESGKLHLWPDVSIVEVVQNDRPVPSGCTGDFICTGLLNAGMPLIRYRVGDAGALDPTAARCTCGRMLPRISAIAGRSDDLIRTPDGREVGRLDPVFKGDLRVQEAQIVQRSVDTICVSVVPAQGFTQHHADLIIARLRDRLGNMHFQIERVELIPRSANGKFRSVISQIR